MKFVIVVNGRVGYRHMAYICMFLLVLFTYFSKIFHANFPPHRTRHLKQTEFTGMGPFKAKYGVAQNDWGMAKIWRGGGRGILGLKV